MTNRRRWFILVACGLSVLLVIGVNIFFFLTDQGYRTVLIILLGLGIMLSLFVWGQESRRREQLARERKAATLVAQALAQELGPQVELLSRAVAGKEYATETVDGGEKSGARVQQEVDRRVEELKESVVGELHAQRMTADSRIKAIEEKFPDAAEFQKYADSGQLFLAYQVSDLSKRIDKLEEKLLTRTQVIGIVVATFVGAIGLIGGLFSLLKALGFMH